MNCSECVTEILNRLTLYKQQLQQRRPRDVKVCVTQRSYRTTTCSFIESAAQGFS